MSKFILILTVLSSPLIAAETAAPAPKTVAAKPAAVIPADVLALEKRHQECMHFGGEEAYDEARKQELIQAVARLKCNDISKDLEGLKAKYKTQSHVISKLNSISEMGAD